MKKLVALASLGVVTAANAASNFAATDSVTAALTSIKTDITSDVTPVAIGVVCSVGALIAGRALVKKFFKI